MARWAGRVVLVALLLHALPAAASHQQAATISVKPNCSNSTTTWVFTVSGTMPGNGVVVVRLGQLVVGTGNTDNIGRYSISVSTPAQGPNSYVVTASQPSTDTVVAARFNAPCPSVTVTPDCSDVAAPGTWTFVASGRMPVNTIVTIFFDGTEVASGDSRDFAYSIPVSVPARAPGSYVVGARHERDPQGSRVETTFGSPCSPRSATTTTAPPATTTTPTTQPPPTTPPPVFTPTLQFNPAVGPAGSATTVVGSGWPPGTPVTLAGNVALGAQPVVADGAGNFSAAVVLLPNSGLGERALTGAGAGRSATTVILVVPSTMQPPRFLFR